MSNSYDVLENLENERRNKRDAITDLVKFSNQKESNIWYGVGEPNIPSTESIIIVIQGKFSIYEDIKLSNGTFILTSKRIILFGTEVKKSLLASTISREIEKKRGLDLRPDKLIDLTNKGGDLPLDQIVRVEIIKSGEIFSLFFFNDVKRIIVINDLEEKEMGIIENYLLEMEKVDIFHDEFRIPLTDIGLIALIAIILAIIGMVIIAIIF